MSCEERYNNALEALREILCSGQESIQMSRLQLRLLPFFPELKESEGERIRKSMICGLNALKDNNKETFAGIPIDDCIAWLERQKEQTHNDESYGMMTPEESLGISSEEYAKIVNESIFGEPPVFEEGNWVVDNQDPAVVSQVKRVRRNEGNGQFEYELANGRIIHSFATDCYHLWTIEDARDGDLIIDENTHTAGIYKETRENGKTTYWESYFYVGLLNKMVYGPDFGSGGLHLASSARPSTIDECMQFHNIVMEAGYQWDRHSKWLKKITE